MRSKFETSQNSDVCLKKARGHLKTSLRHIISKDNTLLGHTPCNNTNKQQGKLYSGFHPIHFLLQKIIYFLGPSKNSANNHISKLKSPLGRTRMLPWTRGRHGVLSSLGVNSRAAEGSSAVKANSDGAARLVRRRPRKCMLLSNSRVPLLTNSKDCISRPHEIICEPTKLPLNQ